MSGANLGAFGRRHVGALMAGVALVTAFPAFAQQDDTAQQAESGGLADIIVTATRRSENLQDVPISISAIGAEQLASRGVNATNDLGSVVPNLQVSSQYGETQPNFSLRGVGVANEFTANTASPIGVYVDEVNQTFRYTHGLQLYDLDRVEVVRGPQGTLFGRNTTGGAVSIYTRQPQLGEANGYFSAGYGNYNRFKAGGAVEVTPVEDKIGLRVAFQTAQGDGYFREPNRAQSVTGAKSYGESDDLGIRANLRLKPSDDLDISISGNFARTEPRGYGLHYRGLVGADANGNGGTDFFGNTRANCCSYKEISLDRGGEFITEAKGGSLRINYNLSDTLSLTSVTGYTRSDYILNIDNDATPSDAYAIVYDSDGKDFSQDFRVGYDSDVFKGLLGVYFGKDSIESFNQVRAYNVFPDAQTPAQFNPGGGVDPTAAATSLNVLFGYKQKRKTIAVYAEGTYSLTDRLELTLGGRYTKDNVDFLNAFSTAFSDFPGNALFDLYNNVNLKNDYDNWSGRAIINYAWSDSIKTYASFSRGFRSATYNGFGFIDRSAVYFVPPEKLDSIEVGFKTRFFDDRIQLNGAAFHYKYKNQQVQEVVGGVAFLRSLNAKVKGGELELLAKPIEALTLRGALGYLDSKYNRNNVLLSGVSVAGNPLPFASKFTVSFGGDLKVFQLGEGDIVVGGEAAYRSKFFYDPFADNLRPNPTGLYGPNLVSERTNLVQAKGYTLVNARLSYVSDSITIGFWGKNIFDKEYFPFGYDTAAAFGTVLLTPGVPRTYGVDARFNF